MCAPVMIAMAVVSAAAAANQAKNQAILEGQQIDAQRRQHAELVRQNNWANADMVGAAQSNYEATRANLTDTNVERMNNLSALETAIGESNMGGRSMERLKNVQNIRYDMQSSDISTNYQRDYQALFADSVGRAESTKAAILGAAPIPVTSKLTQAINITNAGMQGASAGASFGGGFTKADTGSVRGTAGLTPKAKEWYN